MLFQNVSIVLLLACLIANAQNQALNDSIVSLSSSNKTEANFTREDRLCVFVHGFHLSSKEREVECCQQIVEKYETRWRAQNRPLTRYLENLRGWNCPQFREECERKLFAFTPFTKMVYEYFCSYDNYVDQCMRDVKKIVEAAEQRSANMKISTGPSTTPFQGILNNAGNDAKNSSGNQQQWNGFINKIPTTHFSLDELLDPCLQVAQYEAEGDHRGNFHEVLSIAIPFCDLRWQGFTGEYLLEYRVSRWTTFSTKCRVNIGVILAVSALLAVMITFVNIIVIIVILRLSGDDQNSQTIYRLSLAIADLLVGVIVIPTCANTLATFSLSIFEPGDLQLLQGFNYHRNASMYVNLTRRAGQSSNLFPAGMSDYRRRASLASLSNDTASKKCSITEITKNSTGTELTASRTPNDFSSTSQLASTSKVKPSATTNACTTFATNNQTLDETCVQTVTSSSKDESKNTKKQKAEKQDKRSDTSMASENSISKSMVIDVNADRLHLSVIENIDEEIVPNASDAENEENKKT
ncbi:unnamed protein product [Clavelina lepadiformis]|uniref:G-protein coupled receptors family 1 profile domain-containing protein n=2 Tax=Clavelina lepadiformis TaxID=159417 RepID=A0ABP0GTN9_CLALP